MSVKLYLARAMTGRVKQDVVVEAANDKLFLESCGFEVLCPVTEEKLPSTKDVICASKAQMDHYWKRDKQMIREANVVVDMTPHMKSEGVAHELAYARYFLYRPVVRLYPFDKMPGEASVARFEDDALFDSILPMIDYIKENHGTRWKRLKWRAKLYVRCLPKMVLYWFGSWK